MDNVYVYQTKLPRRVSEMVTPCADGYTVYIDKDLTRENAIKAYLHALAHIQRGDFDRTDVQTIETEAHDEG